MKINLHTFESFSMRRDVCDRCKGPTDNITTLSMFNEDVICMKCKDEEKKDPEYEAAEIADYEASIADIKNFGGVMPDYRPLVRK